ncbi:MAG: hypothetical protein ABS95_01135 [Verrucomicrobia bacterium SCN 57-15]|nr:MAG: hypothetical protein ABS95_01135 [Verrucomicrobia bacterium SCN 57-15]
MTATDQLELPVFKPGADQKDIDRFVEILRVNMGWMTARQIKLRTGWCDRKCRALAAASDGQIISGNNGYKHTLHASADEFHEFYGRMTHQGKEMLARAERARRIHHKKVG